MNNYEQYFHKDVTHFLYNMYLHTHVQYVFIFKNVNFDIKYFKNLISFNVGKIDLIYLHVIVHH